MPIQREILYPPPYFREVWHYQCTNTDRIRRAIDLLDWDRAFVNTNINEKVFFLCKTISNILFNFIPHHSHKKRKDSLETRVELLYKHTTCIPRWNDVETTASTSFQLGIHMVCLQGGRSTHLWWEPSDTRTHFSLL